MALVGSFKQQPAETLDYDIDFSEWLPPNDHMVSASVAVTPAGLSTSFAIENQRVKVWCWDGVSNTTYKITVTATTNDFRVKEVEFKVKVKDD